MKYFKNSAVSCASRILAFLALYAFSSAGQAVTAGNTILDQYVGYWKFDEAAGLTAADSAPAGNHGTLQGGATWVAGQIGSALSFDGQTGYVRAGADLNQWLGATASLSVWIKTTQFGKGDFFQSPAITGVESVGDGNDIFWGWIDTTGRIGMQAGNGANAKSLNPINDGQWHHIGLTRDATSGRVSVYVDGVLNATAISETGLKSKKFYGLGRIETTGTPVYFKGQLDEVRLYNFVLGDADMQVLADSSLPAGQPPTISLSPTDQAVLPGQPATFRIEASGTAPLSERWQRNTLDIPDATEDTYTIASSTLADDGAQFRCIVANAYGSVTSAVATLTVTTPIIPPSVPDGVVVFANSASQVTINWNPSIGSAGSGLVGYNIYRNETLVTATTATSYSDGGLLPNTGYCYTIVAYDNLGSTSSPSAQACAMTQAADTTPPSVPSGVSATAVSPTQIALTWNASTDDESGVFAYRIYRNGTFVRATRATNYADSELSAGTRYFYTVLAYDYARNTSSASDPVCATTQAAPPSAPSGVSASAVSPTQIALTWNASTDSGLVYRIYRNGTFIRGTASTSYSDGGLSASTQYCYTIVAYKAGKFSSPSAPVCVTTPANPVPVPDAGDMAADEFVGPFNSWADLQSDYGAVGNGLADDTAALQAALNDLGKTGHSSVLYIPAGIYRVTQTLKLQAREHVSILGEHPDVTRLKWDGAAGGGLLHLDGVAYSRVNRITFDGAGKAGVLVDQSLTGYGQGQFFDSGNEYADDVFQDAVNGIRGGNYDLGAAESSVLRCHFLRHSGAGIILKNFNALDWFIWYCTFDDNYKGVSNNPGAGSFHVFGSLFRRSTNADIDIANTGLFSLRYNTSLGSKRFFNSAFSGANGAELTIQGNTIADTTADDAISLGTMGPVVLVDNVIASRLLALGAAVKQNSYEAPDMVAVGNTFTVASPLSLLGSVGALRLVNLDNPTVLRATLNITAPTLPDVLENYNRPVFDVAAGANAATIQQAVNQAAALNGQRPVVHLPEGNYNIAQTIVVPANADLQIVGDGGRSILQWGGPQGTTPLLRLAGPSRAILRDFAIIAYGGAGIVVENADQAGGRIFAEQAFLTRGMTANLLVDQLERATVELHDLYQSQTSIAPAATGTGVKVVGGPNAASGNPQGGKVSIFAGATANNYLSFDVINGGRLLVNDIWYEGPVASTFAHIAGNSTFTLQGSRLALPVNGYSIRIDDLDGKVTVLTSHPDAPIVISGSGNGTVWVAGNESHGPSNYFADNSPSILGVFTNNRWYDPSYGSRSSANQGTADNNLVTTMLAHMRSERPLAEPTVLPAGVTDLRLYRIFIDATTIGLRLQP